MSLGKHQRLAVGDVRTFHKNPRKGDVEAIAGSLRVNNQYRPIVVNKGTHTGRPNECLAGNHTLMAARSLAEEDKAWDKIDAWVIDVDDDQANRIVLADNRTADLGSYDNTALVDLMRQLDDGLDGTGYVDDDLDDLVAMLEESAPDDPSDYPGADGEPLDDDDEELGEGLRNSFNDSDQADAYADRATRMFVFALPINQYVWVSERLDEFNENHPEIESHSELLIAILEEISGEYCPPPSVEETADEEEN